MTPDARTLAFYDRAAKDYAAKMVAGHVRPELDRFIALLPPTARVLDIGCGPGNASAAMARAGHRPDPVDASTGMVDFARATYGVPARLGTLDTDFGTETYDGIWASYVLLHARVAEIPGIVARLIAALRPGGPLYIGLKLGDGELRDSLDRFYSHVPEDALMGWVTGGGLRIVEAVTGEVEGMDGVRTPCIDLIAVKPADG